ncbi:unnamed protein product [Zymoseptoria tritici ST99CH_3D1]|nr:unnamed protein product [Zymoseptoria tritici ST99CH_3D1]
MATAPCPTRKREGSPSPSALDTPPSKRRAPRTSASPWKNPLLQNSDFSSPIFNRSLDIDRNDSDINMAGSHIDNNGTLSQHVRAQNQFQNELQAANPNPYSAPHPMLAVPSPTLNLDDFLHSDEDIHTADAQDLAQAQNTVQHHTQGTTAAESDIQGVMQRRRFPVISRKEIWGVDRMGEYDQELMAGADDGGRGQPPVRTQVALRSPSLARSDRMGSDGEEEVFVDAEEEISPSGSELASDEEAAGSDEDDEDSEEDSAEGDHRRDSDVDSEATDPDEPTLTWADFMVTPMTAMAVKIGEESGIFKAARMGAFRNTAESKPQKNYPSENRERMGGNHDKYEGGQEGSAAGQDSQDAEPKDEADEDGEQTGEGRNPANADVGSDNGSGGEADEKEDEPSDFETLDEEDDKEQTASQVTAGDSQVRDSNVGSQDQRQQAGPQTTIIDLLSDDDDEPSQSLEMLDDGGTKHADSLFSKAFKNTPKVKKSKAHVTDSSASSTAEEQASSAFSGGPSSRIKSRPGPHQTRISTSSSPPPQTNTTTPTSRPPRPRPDTRRDLSRHLAFHSKFHNAALHLIPRLPSYESFAWTRRYWIAVLLPKKNLSKPHFSEKDFVWFKGNKFTTVETVWNYFQTTTMSDPDDLALLVGGVEGVGFKDQMRELDYFGDKFVVFQALGKEGAEEVEGRSLVEGVVPKGVVEVVELVDDDDEE